MSISTRPARMTERDLKILQAMVRNVAVFINEADRKASENEGEAKDVEVTFIVEEF